MRAATHSRYGAPDVLEMVDSERPSIGDGEVLIEVHASPVTQGDRRLRAADFPGISAVLGRLMFGVFGPRSGIPGSNFAGRIVAVGSDVTRFEIGDDVFGSRMKGAHAEYLTMPGDGELTHMPAGSSYAEAAALPYGAVTALVFLKEMARVQPGESVLVVGAAGGVGRFAVQVARHLGAEVTGVDSREHDLVADLGAAHVIDYTREDFTKNGRRYDVILDTTEENRFRSVRGSLTPRGRYLSLYMTVRGMLEMGMTAIGGGQRAISGVAMPSRELLEAVRELAESGALRAVIARRFPLENIVEAHALLEAGSLRGTVVLDIVPDIVPSAIASVRANEVMPVRA